MIPRPKRGDFTILSTCRYHIAHARKMVMAEGQGLEP